MECPFANVGEIQPYRLGSYHHVPNKGRHSLHLSAQTVRNSWDSRLPEDWDGPKHLSRGRCLRSGKFLKAEQKKPDILWAESFKKSVKTGRGWSCWRGATAAICIFQHWRKSKYIKPHSHDSSDEIILLMGVTFVMSLSLNSNTAGFIAAHKWVCLVCFFFF